MNKRLPGLLLVGLLGMMCGGDAEGRGFGGFRGASFCGYRSASFSGFDRSGSFSSSRSADSYSGWRGAGAYGSYDRSYSGSRGGSFNVEGTRGAAFGPRGGAVAGGTRDVTATGPGGGTYSSEMQRGAAVGPYGRTIGGSSGYRSVSGLGGTASRGWESAFAGTRFPTDTGLYHYAAYGSAGLAHSTAYWSRGYTATHAAGVRTSFGYYNAFHPTWITAHPGAWYAAGWNAGAAWRTATWATVAAYCGMASSGGAYVPVDYDYGNTVIYQDNSVYENGQPVATADQYAQQATTLAEQGQKAAAPTTAEWKALGVFALVQGEEKTSNNIFQLAIDKDGVIRGNFYDGLTDTTTPVYGSVDKKTQRAAWTIGKKNDRVFDAGVYNLTQEQTPVLVHIGKDRTQQLLLVRMESPKDN